MESKIPLSVAIITKNEASNLPRCLESVNFVDQIVIVDSDSVDDTVKIALEHGCEVFIEPWRGFGYQKQFAVDRCKHEWILVLDADECVPLETAMQIKRIVTNPSIIAAGYSFPRKNYFQGRWIKHMGWWPDRVIRLFRKTSGKVKPVNVHESIEIDGVVKELTVPIEHFTASSFSQILEKINQYSTLGAQEAFAEGKTSSILGAVFRANLAFFRNYFLRFGFLEGVRGLTLALTDSVNKFFKYAKLSEMIKQKNRETQSDKHEQ